MRHHYTSDGRSDLLLWDLAKAMRIDLTEAVCSDGLRFAALDRLLHACNLCPDPQLCAVFLTRRKGQSDRAPTFCPNRTPLTKLQRRFPAHSENLTQP